LNKRFIPLLLLAAIIAALAWIGHGLLFSTFMLYDDEGYVLITLRDFGRHGGLYDLVFSQYGPAFYLGYDALQRLLHFDWTNTVGRWITLCNWLGTAGICALILRRARLGWPLALFGFVDVFTYLWIMINEPMHPGGTIALMVALAAWLGWEALQRGRMDWFAVVAGCVGALLALVKINVGAFLIIAAIFWLVLAHPEKRTERRLLSLIAVGALLPAVLMRTLIAESWVQTFIPLSAMATATVLICAAPTASIRPATNRVWVCFFGTGLFVTLAVAILLLVRGTSLSALVEGVFLGPLKHPTVYSFPMRWRPGVLLVGAMALSLAWLWWRQPENPRLRLTIAWLRIATTILFQFTLVPSIATSQVAMGLCYGLPLAGLFACRLRSQNETTNRGNLARIWLALVFALQSLHAYPVAGSQLSWGTFLWLPLMLLGLQEALDVVLAGGSLRLLSFVRASVAAIAMVLCGGTLWHLSKIARHNLADGQALNLPGAEKIVLPTNIASALRVISENAKVHADVLLSLPGAYSLNLWSGIPTPTLQNVTHWFSLMDEQQQSAITHSLEDSPRSAFVVQYVILAGLSEQGFHPAGPVLNYVRNHYHRVFALDGYSFWVRNGRTIAPLSTGLIRQTSDATNPAYLLKLILAPRAGKVASVELWNVSGGEWRVLDLDVSTTSVAATPLHLNGAEDGPTRHLEWPFAIDRVMRLDLSFTAKDPLPPAASLLVTLKDEAGRTLGQARILPPNALEPPSGAQSAAR